MNKHSGLVLVIIKLTLTYLRSGKCWIADHVRDDAGDLVHLVHDLVDVDAAAVGHLPVVAVPGGKCIMTHS